MQGRRIVIAALAVLAGTAAARADAVSELFGDGTGRGCYIRHYDAAHLARNPKQRVAVIAFDHEPQTSAESRRSFGPIQFGVAVRFRSKADGEGGAPSFCKDSGGKIACFAEADAGTFEVARAGPDQIRLTMTRGLGFETASKKGYVSMEDGPDDKVFVLRKAPFKACDILR